MANIKVTIDYPISDGTKLKFRTPCESTEVEGLVVKYPVKDGVGSALKTFRFVDAHGTELSGIGNVFTSDVMIEILLDVTKGRAFIQNADTNSYIEDIKVTVKRMDEERQTIFAEAGKVVKECNDATKDANEAANTLNLSADEVRSGGFVEALKELNKGKKIMFWVGTQEEYIEQKANIPENTYCIIKNNNSAVDILSLVEDGKVTFDPFKFDKFVVKMATGNIVFDKVYKTFPEISGVITYTHEGQYVLNGYTSYYNPTLTFTTVGKPVWNEASQSYKYSGAYTVTFVAYTDEECENEVHSSLIKQIVGVRY